MTSILSYSIPLLAESNPPTVKFQTLDNPSQRIKKLPPDDDKIEVAAAADCPAKSNTTQKVNYFLQIAMAELIQQKGAPEVAPNTGVANEHPDAEDEYEWSPTPFAHAEILPTDLHEAVISLKSVEWRPEDGVVVNKEPNDKVLVETREVVTVCGVAYPGYDDRIEDDRMTEAPLVANRRKRGGSRWLPVPSAETVIGSKRSGQNLERNRKRLCCLRVYREDVRPKDVLLEQGEKHPGNMWLRKLVATNLMKYDDSLERDKSRIANWIIQKVVFEGGRFLERKRFSDESREEGQWCWVEVDRLKARDKVSSHFVDERRRRRGERQQS